MTNLLRYNADRFLQVNRFGQHPKMTTRLELFWQAGKRGKPSINANILDASEAVRMIADPDFEILGTNGTSALSTFNVEGGITITTAGADADSMIVLPHLDASQSAWGIFTWGTDRETWWECYIQTGANITNTVIWAGLKLTNTPTTATDDNQVFFRYEDDVSSGVFVCVDSISGTDVSTATDITVAVSTKYHLAIKIGSDRKAEFYINGVLKRKSSALTTAIDLIPYIGVKADGAAAAKNITVFSQAISREYGA